MIPAGVSTALLIVVFGSESDVRLAQEPGAARAPEAGGEAAASANACADGAIDVPAMVTIGAPPERGAAAATPVSTAVAPRNVSSSLRQLGSKFKEDRLARNRPRLIALDRAPRKAAPLLALQCWLG